jgi:peroxiredoxin
MFSEDVQSFLGPGDRAPNFVLPAADGLLWVFYERVRGFRNILLVCPAGWREAEGELTALADAWPRLQELGVDVFALFDGGVEETARLSEGLSLPFLVFADPEGRFRVPYAKGFGRDPSRPVCLLLDENQRVGAVLDPAEESFAARALAAFASGPPAGPAELRAGTAPVLIVPDVLDSRACASLIALWHGSHEEGVAQGRDMDGQDVVKVDYAYKKRRDHQVEDPRAAAWLGRVLSRRVGPELAKAFHLDRFAFDRFVVTCYDAERGDYFRPSGQYDGGDTGPHLRHDAEPEHRRLHGRRPALSGVRPAALRPARRWGHTVFLLADPRSHAGHRRAAFHPVDLPARSRRRG